MSGTLKNYVPVLLLGLVLGGGSVFLFQAQLRSSDQNKPNQNRESSSNVSEETLWTCPMHPSVREPDPGKCPVCKMDLVEAAEDDLFTGDELRKARVQTVQVKRSFVTRELSLYGKVEVDETRKSSVTAWVEGRVEKLHVNHHGMKIEKGEPMVELYSPTFRSTHSELIMAANRKGQRAKRELQSIRNRLMEWGLPRYKIDELQQRDEPRNRITIPAPASGTIQMIHPDEGDWVNRRDPIYTLVDLSRVWITIHPYEKDLSALRYGQKATVHPEAYPGETFTGRVDFINRFVDDSSRTIHAHIHTKNPEEKLKPGMYVNARVRARLAAGNQVVATNEIKNELGQKVTEQGYVSEQNAVPPLVIPETAPLGTGKRAVVYVRSEEVIKGPDGKRMHRFEPRNVKLGPRADGHYIVRDGLEEGEWVVSRGAFRIDSELQIRGEPSKMYPQGGSGGKNHDH